MDIGLFYVLIGFLFFCSFLFTFLIILKLIRKRTTLSAFGVLFFISGVLTVIVFKTDFIYEVNFSMLTWYCIVSLVIYMVCRILVTRKPA